MKKILISLMTLCFVGLLFAEVLDYFPVTKGMFWQYLVTDGNGAKTDTLSSTYCVEIRSDSTFYNGSQRINLSTYYLDDQNNQQDDDGNRFWVKKGDSVYVVQEDIYTAQFFSHLADVQKALPGDTLFKTYSSPGDLSSYPFIYHDTLVILPEEVVSVPLGTFNCTVTAFRSNVGHSHFFGGQMVLGETYIIYKALGVGIVKQKSIYKNGRVSEFLLKEKRLPDPPFQINIKQPANQGSLLKTKPRDNTDRIVYNVYGQKISRNSLNSSNTQAGVYFVADKTKDGFVNVGKVVVN